MGRHHARGVAGDVVFAVGIHPRHLGGLAADQGAARLPATSIDEQEACDSYAWINGTVYTESTNEPTFTIEGGAANGCDSIVNLHLTINESVTVEYYLTIHESDLPYTYGDTTFEPGSVQSGDYTFNLTTADGCDSIIVLHLTVLTGINDHLMTVDMNVYPNPTEGVVNVQLIMNNQP